MSKARVKFDISSVKAQELVWKRLGEIAIYDYLNNHYTITENNTTLLRSLVVGLLTSDYENQVGIVMDWLFELDNKPNKFELMLLYNQCETNSRYVKKHLHVSSSNIMKFRGKNKTIKKPTLPTGLIIAMVSQLVKIDWTLNDYYVCFRNAKWK